ncbi:MAG: hypothetical protein Q8P41_12130 [Pseudomonadota bacterium]|nr:hypothetical protein [Pseudomonadota bacterium]
MIRPLPALLLLGACAVAEDPSAAASAAASTGPSERAAAVGIPQDRAPGRRTLGSDGAWEAVVAEGGALSVRPAGAFGAEVPVDADVDARVALDGATLVYARRGDLVETDLWRVTLPDGVPERLTDWVGSEDRPLLSPDGRRLAFVSGRTGLASWWVIDLDGARPVPVAAARQVTNVGVTRGRPGVAPEGFTPPPDGTTYAWTAGGLEWVAEGVAHTAVVP